MNYYVTTSIHLYKGKETDPNKKDWDDYEELDAICPRTDPNGSFVREYEAEYIKQITELFETCGDSAESVDDACIKFSNEAKDFEIWFRIEGVEEKS